MSSCPGWSIAGGEDVTSISETPVRTMLMGLVQHGQLIGARELGGGGVAACAVGNRSCNKAIRRLQF